MGTRPPVYLFSETAHEVASHTFYNKARTQSNICWKEMTSVVLPGFTELWNSLLLVLKLV